MTKRLHVRPDNDINTISVSQACNIYGLPRYRVYEDDREYFIAENYPHSLFYIIATKDNSVYDVLYFRTTRELFSYLMHNGFEIDVVIDEEE